MRTMTFLFFILSLGILSLHAQPAAAHGTVDQHWVDQHWVDQLKKTPVNQLEADSMRKSARSPE